MTSTSVVHKCPCDEDLLKEIDSKISCNGTNLLHSNIYGLKKNFSQKYFNKLLAYKEIVLYAKCCLSKTLYSQIIEKIKTEI